MSMKVTKAFSDKFHLYEELGDNRGLWLQVGGSEPVLLEKEILQKCYPVLAALDKKGWELLTDAEIAQAKERQDFEAKNQADSDRMKAFWEENIAANERARLHRQKILAEDDDNWMYAEDEHGS